MSADDAPLSSPGINYPPPLIYVAGIVLGLLVNWLRPLPITGGPSLLRFALALVCGIAGGMRRTSDGRCSRERSGVHADRGIRVPITSI